MDSLSYRKSRPTAEEQPDSIAENLSFETPGNVPPAPVRRETHRSGSAHKGGGNMEKRSIWAAGAVGVLAVAGLMWWLFMGGTGNSAPLIDSGKYQAVFLTNGQVYFGKLSQQNSTYMRIKEVFYLQRKTTTNDKTNPQETTEQSTGDVELIKLGNEIHGPEDQMVIPKDQILFYENLKSDGTVAKSISQYQQTQKK